MKDDNFLKEHNARALWHPMGAPGDSLATPPTIITRAEGSRIFDIDGHATVDGVGGLWCANLGYSNDAVKEAISRQLYDLPYYSAFAGSTNPTAIEASVAVQEFFAEDGIGRVFFTSGGSDSVETCLRLSRQYHRIKGKPQRTKFLSLKKGYHGTHFGGASVNGNARFRTAYEPLLAGCFHMTAPYPYRNPYAETDPAAPLRDDGYLTASEVTLLDLSAVDLVVLSACETGLGRPQSGEGLLGLRRAFHMAGADTVISSLWSVKDESTSELMQSFYANLFFKGMGRHEALRAAQLEMLQRNRMEHGNALPSTWGAFVLSGEWR